ncbi:hypothetical protein [Dyella mobilis]|uniref:Porin n=1 Tax=Dyella mobilis TaxID=1849582 RepID=A0ABS2KKF0_9GAMM|nr:hypothetical protein [Dyella mobilis]MBM7131647.1 hypothetical protein [Dyella mobilis]GLQ96377.1 hypothetical protein GCM10007863_07950 [Dyella mobilis]
MHSLGRRTALVSALLALAVSQAALADDGFSYRFSGFGTLGYVQTNTNDLTFLNPGQEKGATKSGSLLVDSRLGAQVDVNFNDQLSATVQGLAQQDAKGQFEPTLEWAFLRYKPLDSVSVRVGRLGWPAYLVSDYRYVGYANPWLRAPLEVYDLAVLDYFDGGDVTWTHALGPGTVSVQVLAGSADTDLPDTSQQTAKLGVHQLYGGYVTYDIGDFHLRGGASTAHIDYTSGSTAPLFAGLQQAGFGSIADSLEANNKRATFVSLGGTYDAHNILATAEYGALHSSSFLARNNGWYGTLGYHFGSWTPYVTYGGTNKPSEVNSYGVPAFGPLLPLSQGVDALVSHTYQHTTSLGVRWDVYKNIDIKAQLDHVTPSANGGDFADVSPTYDGHSVNVYSAVVDFVF